MIDQQTCRYPCGRCHVARIIAAMTDRKWQKVENRQKVNRATRQNRFFFPVFYRETTKKAYRKDDNNIRGLQPITAR